MPVRPRHDSNKQPAVGTHVEDGDDKANFPEVKLDELEDLDEIRLQGTRRG